MVTTINVSYMLEVFINTGLDLVALQPLCLIKFVDQ